MELAGVFARTFAIGAAIAAPIGAMGMLCIQRTLERGARAGLLIGLGIATADGVYAALAAFGVSAVSSALVSWQVPLQLAGGAVLVWLGLRAMAVHEASRAMSPEGVAACAGDGRSRGDSAAQYASAVGLTLANPMTILSFVAVFASAALGAGGAVSSAAAATAGVVAGSLAWWIALVTGVSLVRERIGARAIAAVGRVSGAALVVFGMIAVLGVLVR